MMIMHYDMDDLVKLSKSVLDKILSLFSQSLLTGLQSASEYLNPEPT